MNSDRQENRTVVPRSQESIKRSLFTKYSQIHKIKNIHSALKMYLLLLNCTRRNGYHVMYILPEVKKTENMESSNHRMVEYLLPD